MTNSEIVQKFIRKKGLRLVSGTDDGFNLLLPWMMMAVQYQLYNSTIRAVQCGHELQQAKTRWIEASLRFDNELYCEFTDMEKAEISDRAEALEKYIEKDVIIAKLQFMNCVSFYPISMQDIIATAMMCHVLAVSAQVMYGEVYVTPSGKPKRNRNIETVETNTFRFASGMHELFSDKIIQFSSDQNVMDAIKILQHKMIHWLKLTNQSI